MKKSSPGVTKTDLSTVVLHVNDLLRSNSISFMPMTPRACTRVRLADPRSCYGAYLASP